MSFVYCLCKEYCRYNDLLDSRSRAPDEATSGIFPSHIKCSRARVVGTVLTMNSGRAAAILASVLGSLFIIASVWLLYKWKARPSASRRTTGRPPPLKRLMVRRGRTIPIPDYRPPSNTSENASSLYHSSWYLSTAPLPRHVAASLRAFGKFKNRSSQAAQDLEKGLPGAEPRLGTPPVPELPTSRPQTPHPSPCNTPSPHTTRSSANRSTINRESLMKPLPQLPIQRSATMAIDSRSHHKQSSLFTSDRKRPLSTPLQAEVRTNSPGSTFLDTSSEEDINAINGRQDLRSKVQMPTENDTGNRDEPCPRRSASAPRPASMPSPQCETEGILRHGRACHVIGNGTDWLHSRRDSLR